MPFTLYLRELRDDAKLVRRLKCVQHLDNVLVPKLAENLQQRHKKADSFNRMHRMDSTSFRESAKQYSAYPATPLGMYLNLLPQVLDVAFALSMLDDKLQSTSLHKLPETNV